MKRKISAGALLVLTLGLAVPALSACSGGDADDSTSVGSAAGPMQQMAPTSNSDTAVKQQAPGGSGFEGAPGTTDEAQRAVVTTITTVVEVSDVPAATARVIAATTAAKGYVQAQYSTATSGKSDTTTLTVRIPTALGDQFLASVANLGTVTSTDRSSDDVTAEVADIDARLANAKAGVVRLRALMAKATKVSDIVAIESALSERQAEAESLAAQQRALADLTSLATITVVLSPAPDSPPTGFIGGLGEGWNAFKSSVSTLARYMGYVIPFAIVGLLLAGLSVAVVRWAIRRRREHADSAHREYANRADAAAASADPAQSNAFPVAQAAAPTPLADGPAASSTAYPGGTTSPGATPPDPMGGASQSPTNPYGTGTT